MDAVFSRKAKAKASAKPKEGVVEEKAAEKHPNLLEAENTPTIEVEKSQPVDGADQIAATDVKQDIAQAEAAPTDVPPADAAQAADAVDASPTVPVAALEGE